MTSELTWLTLTILVTALFWMPYVLNRMAVRGVVGAMGNATADSAPHSSWAQRAIAAHDNAIENLVIFAALILIAHAAGISNSITVGAAMIYFFARVAHYIIYLLGVPVLRTLTFAVGWMCQIAVALNLLGAI